MERFDEPTGSSGDIPKTPEETITKAETELVVALKKNYMKNVDIDLQFQKEKFLMEQRFEELRNSVYAERKELLDGAKDNNAPGIPFDSPFKAFWMTVLKCPFCAYMSSNDEEILIHLMNVRSVFTVEPKTKFELIFEFAPNEYFENTRLTKTYFLNTDPDPNDPIKYDGAEIYKCEGTKINWKDPSFDPTHVIHPTTLVVKAVPSFFCFFAPPNMPDEDDQSPAAKLVRRLLKNDFEIGFFMKECVIPKAILFFTGELGCASSPDSSFEYEFDDDSDENNDDDFDENTTEHIADRFKDMGIHINFAESKHDAAAPEKSLDESNKSAGEDGDE